MRSTLPATRPSPHHVSPGADHLVCSAVLSPGYRLGDHLLRPATVEVTGPAPPARSGPGREQDIRLSSAPADKPPLPTGRS
ncbi:nucleotide exchange factor GrpE [Streptomyces niger]|uniref:hypothetical protein n=1 Tax=Streptomyces niger TaxID=66373 RepID=UPI001F21C65B|nr:hypothetical protein [Streptomyces niger]